MYGLVRDLCVLRAVSVPTFLFNHQRTYLGRDHRCRSLTRGGSAVNVPYKECANQLVIGALPAVSDSEWQGVRDAFEAVKTRHAGVSSTQE